MSQFKVLWCSLSLAFMLPAAGYSQVFNTAESLPRASLALSSSPAVFMDDGANVIALFVSGVYGIGNGLDLHVRSGFFESANYIGANLEWTTRPASPFFSLSAGAHFQEDPALDGSLNLTFNANKGFGWYIGLDADLVLDDDPDLPAWVFLGGSYNVIDQIDILAEFNYGVVEIAPHILAAGFVFYF